MHPHHPTRSQLVQHIYDAVPGKSVAVSSQRNPLPYLTDVKGMVVETLHFRRICCT